MRLARGYYGLGSGGIRVEIAVLGQNPFEGLANVYKPAFDSTSGDSIVFLGVVFRGWGGKARSLLLEGLELIGQELVCLLQVLNLILKSLSQTLAMSDIW